MLVLLAGVEFDVAWLGVEGRAEDLGVGSVESRPHQVVVGSSRFSLARRARSSRVVDLRTSMLV